MKSLKHYLSTRQSVFDVPSTSAIYEYVDRAIEHTLARTDIPFTRGERGRLYAWNWGYWGRVAVDMLQSTGEERFAELIRRATRRLLAERDDVLGLVDSERGKVVPCWGVKFPNGRSNEITVAGLVCLPMAEYAAMVGDATVEAAVQETLAAFLPEREQHEDGCYFVHKTAGAVEALNHTHVYGAALAHASRFPDAPADFRSTALGIQKYFDHFKRYEEPWFDARPGVERVQVPVSWPYAPSPSSSKVLASEAIWKASTTIELPVALVEVGLLEADTPFRDAAMSLLGSRLVGTGQLPQFIGNQRQIALSDEFDRSSSPGGLASWFQLNDAELSRTVWGLMRAHQRKFPGGWLGGSRAMLMGLSHLIKTGMVNSLDGLVRVPDRTSP